MVLPSLAFTLEALGPNKLIRYSPLPAGLLKTVYRLGECKPPVSDTKSDYSFRVEFL